MHHLLHQRLGASCLFVLLLMLPGITFAVQPVRLAMAEPLTSSWHAPEPAFDTTSSSTTTPWVHIRVEPSDTLSGLFDSVGLDASQWRAILELGETVDALRQLSPGDEFRLRKTPDGRLATLHFPINATDTLVIQRTDNGLTAQIAHPLATTRQVQVGGPIGSSLSKSLERAHVPDTIAARLTRIFSGRNNLSQIPGPGDRFSILYAAEFMNNSPIHIGPIIAASIHTQGKDLRVFRYVGTDGEAGYYDSHGNPYKPGIERTPLKYEAVTSPFDMRRMNPVLGVVRPHTGVDLAAPRNTPVHAAADGIVTFAGWLSGYGRIVKIDHGMGYSTRYAHMAGFASGLEAGDHVEQGQTIGYVGHSGVATGNHLHYEILENGVPHNPLTMKLPSGKPLTGPVLTAFTNRIQPLIARLSGTASQTLVAANDGSQINSSCSQAGTVNALLALAPRQVESKTLDQVFCTING